MSGDGVGSNEGMRRRGGCSVNHRVICYNERVRQGTMTRDRR